ncbi:methylated-DNA--[protein]-cysteine S-methyltransferase [Streptomyces sp. NPDC090442]|uniref:methylated-DNA--[protein]-cysteine S-methyltransferase n=1 Tax=Streptomyces sp. NPDC090442 TaxID=3365962 RepID=UPI0037FD1948
MTAKNLPPVDSVALAVHRTAFGPLVLGASEEALLYCVPAPLEDARARIGRAARTCVEEPALFSAAQARLLAQARAEIDSYLRRERSFFTVRLDLRLATPFCKEVVLSLEELVPYGRTTTYAALARDLQRPTAARAVGTALGANPLCLILPCHRVNGSRGLTGYAGGLTAKRFLLDLENSVSATPEELLLTPATPGGRPAR